MIVFETILNCTPVIPNISHIHIHHRHRRHVSNFRAGQIIFLLTLILYNDVLLLRRTLSFRFYEAYIIAFVAYYYATRSIYIPQDTAVYLLYYYMYIDANHRRTFFNVFFRYIERN